MGLLGLYIGVQHAKKGITIVSPLYDPDWILYPEVPNHVEDTLLGCLRSYKAELETSGEYVDYHKLLSVLYNDEQISSQTIVDRLRCAPRTARKYMQVIKTFLVIYELLDLSLIHI